MKRLIKKFSFISIAIATALLVITLSTINLDKSAIAFEYFPLNEAQTVNFQAKAASLRNLTERQKKDQFLDWLLFTVESDPSFSTKEITEASYDISPVRFDYLTSVSNFEYGNTRSLYLGKKIVIALIPQNSSPEQRIDYLSHIADKHRQNLGRIPEKLEVFEYQLDLDEETAQLTRTEELETNSLFKDNQYGYYETTLKTVDDLNKFMAKVNDITFAKVTDSGLVVGGRKIQSHSYGTISVEDVAALWQSENKIQKEIEQLYEDVYRNNISSYQLLSQSEFEKKFEQDLAEEWQKLKLVNGSGFSLDPAYDYQGLKESLTQITPRLIALKSNGQSIFSNQEIEQVQQSLSKNYIVPYLKLIDKLESKPEVVFSFFETPSPELLEEIVSQFAAGKNDEEVYELILQKNPAFTEISRFLATPRTKSFQAARYDGDLQGTEVGMVLYYTDLLAKLWVLDYLGTTPERYIADFQPLTQISAKVSSIYEQELREVPSTRVWFGNQNKGFQVDNNKILFSRNATRIFAASSNPLEPGKETTARIDSEAFLGWWDEHYEEIARYEPQYERLNEIMKWSLVISWLNESEKGELLEFLQDVPVSHDNWFPDWVQANINELKFQEWDAKTCSEDFYNSSEQTKVCFYPRGYKGTTTEAMPRLSSESFIQFGESGFISGGVSLANPRIIAKSSPLPKATKIKKPSWRSYIDYNSINLNNNILSFNTLDGATYKLKITPELTSVIAKAKDGAKLGNLDSQLINVDELVRQISRTDNGITINALAEDINIGNVNISKTRNAFKVGWQAQDLDVGQSLALELSRRPRNTNIETFLNKHSKVNSLAKSKDGSVYYVKTDNSDKWLKLASGGDDGKIPPGYISRVASIEPPPNFPGRPRTTSDNPEYLLGWVDDLDDIEAEVIFIRKKSKNSAISNDIRKGDYIAATPKIIRQKKLNKALTEINGLMKSRDFERAAKLVDNSIKEFGKEPDLMIRKAAINIKLKRLKVEAISIKKLETPKDANFLDEVNGILKNQDKGKFNAIAKDDAFIYVQDNPELNNIDWSTPIEDSTSFMSGKTRVYKVQKGEIGDMNLDEFFPEEPPRLPPRPPIENPSGPQPPNPPGGGKYNNSQYYRGAFRSSRIASKPLCGTSKEDEIKTAECKQEKDVYIMYSHSK